MVTTTGMRRGTKQLLAALQGPFVLKTVLRQCQGERLEFVVVFDPGDEPEREVARRIHQAAAPVQRELQDVELSVVTLTPKHPASSDLQHYFPSYDVVFPKSS